MTYSIRTLDLRDFVSNPAEATIEQLEAFKQNTGTLAKAIEAELVRRKRQNDRERALTPETLRKLKAVFDAAYSIRDKTSHMDAIRLGLEAVGPEGLSVCEIEMLTGISTRGVDNALERGLKRGEFVQLERKRWHPESYPARRRRRHHVWVRSEHAGDQAPHERRQ